MDTRTFFDAIFGQIADEQNRICIWALPSQAWRFFAEPSRAAGYATGAVSKSSDIYFGVATMREAANKRGALKDVAGVPSLWCDIDVAGPGHKDTRKRLPPSFDEARKILDRIGVPPSIVVNSGGGLQAYWLLDEAFSVDADNVEQLTAIRTYTRRWFVTIAAVADSIQYDVDPVHDPTRVMRVPGTFNRKTGTPRPVTIERGDARLRYSIGDLETWFVAEETTTMNKAPLSVYVAPVILRADADPPAMKLSAAMTNDPKFKKTWNMERKDMKDQSPSSYDMALAHWGTAAGWPDQDIANLIVAFRRERKLDMAKALRRDYIQRTIQTAKMSRRSESAIANLANSIPQKPLIVVPADPSPQHGDAQSKAEAAAVAKEGDQGVDDKTRSEALATLSDALCIPIARVVQMSSENSIYYVVLADGREVKIGPVSSLLNPDRFREPLIDATGVLVPTFKRDAWKNIAMVLLSIRETVENEEMHDDKRGRRFIQNYLDSMHLYDAATYQEALPNSSPFVKDGHIWLNADALRRHLKRRQGENIEPAELYHFLRKAGFNQRTVSGHVGGRATSRSYWRCTIDDASDLLPSVRPGDGQPASADDHEGGDQDD